MLFNPFKKGGGGKKRTSLETVLNDLTQKAPSSANCSQVKTHTGEEANEDLGRAFLFKYNQDLFVHNKNKVFYISTPDGIKAQDKSLLTGKDEVIHLWFLFNRIPHTLDCRVMGRIRFPNDMLGELDPRVPLAYALKPVGVIRKTDKRQFLRYSHKVGHGGMRVYSQVLFDLYITNTDVTFPETGSLPSYLNDFNFVPFSEQAEVAEEKPEEVVKFMKNSLRVNSRENRVVFVGKPHMEERTNKVSLLEMGQSDVLGLETSKDESRTFYIRKPPRMSSDRNDPFGLQEGDTIVLGFNTRVSTESPTEYYELVSEVTRVGTENMTVRTNGDIRKEAGIPVEMDDFSVGGIKVEANDALLTYFLGDEHKAMPLEDKIEALESSCYLLNFYPKLRFNRETNVYEPELPMRIQILGKVVRTETSTPQEDEPAEITGMGMKFYYDPSEYSRDTFSYDRWELIRDFKENKHFREVHNSLNGLIAFLESQSR